MSLIRVLPPDVAAKIAAGEVVERPASVVKELLDNAIDAGANRITVDVEDGGRKLIRVVDNGCGMSREDVRLAVERHATSKIETAEDLDAIATFGFRGEALASIAAVSRFELITRQADDLEGICLRMEGTVEPEIEPIGCAAGTSLTASDLYFNTPARRKFLKTTSTELSHVSDMVNRAALPHHGVHFTLRHNGKPVLDYPKVETRRERLFAFLGKNVWENLRKLPDTGGGSASASAGISIEGFASIPTETRNRADLVLFFVNDRYVQNRMLLSAVMEAYRRLLHPGRYPILTLFLYLDPGTIDINVHPKKQEVKFADEQKIWRMVHASVREALSQMEQEAARLQSPFPEEPEEDLLPQAPSSAPAPGARSDERKEEPVAPGLRPSQADEIRRAVDRFFEKQGQTQGDETVAPPASVETPSEAGAASPPDAAPVESSRPEPKVTARLFDKESKPVVRAQILDAYLVCEQAGQMVIVDQHAAAERIRYERLKAQMAKGGIEQQTLMFPVTLEVAPGNVELMQDNLPELATLGFDLEYFGQNTFAVNAMPALYKMEECQSLVQDVLNDLTRVGDGTAMDELQEKLLVSMACHRSIRAGDRLSPEAMQDLIDRLFEAEHPYTCPHGRPTLVALGQNELERLFKRSGF